VSTVVVFRTPKVHEICSWIGVVWGPNFAPLKNGTKIKHFYLRNFCGSIRFAVVIEICLPS